MAPTTDNREMTRWAQRDRGFQSRGHGRWVLTMPSPPPSSGGSAFHEEKYFAFVQTCPLYLPVICIQFSPGRTQAIVQGHIHMKSVTTPILVTLILPKFSIRRHDSALPPVPCGPGCHFALQFWDLRFVIAPPPPPRRALPQGFAPAPGLRQSPRPASRHRDPCPAPGHPPPPRHSSHIIPSHKAH